MKIGKSKKIVVAMSGGVDSSAAAALLKKQDYFVMGVFMKFWKDPSVGLGRAGENRCCSTESEKMARLVAKQLDIPFYVLNVEKEFKKKVVDYFLRECKAGNTPNPCVVCNKEIKFGLLIEKALKMGADYVATGHYARLGFPSLRGRTQSEAKGTDEAIQSYRLPRRLRASRNDTDFKLLKGKDKNKDQSYFLWQLNQKQLTRVLFPVGNYAKPEVRKLAKKFNLPIAETPESQEVCFVRASTNDFLKRHLKMKPGKITDKSGKVLGAHQGLWFYTIGQRKGIGLGGSASTKGSGETKPWFVVEKNLKKNILIVSKNQKDLFKKELTARDINWISGKKPKLPIKIMAKIRYKSALAGGRIMDSTIRTNGTKSKARIVFNREQRAITPGQSVVFYRGKELLGGGVIDKYVRI